MYLNNWKSLDDMKDDFWPDYGEELKDELDGASVLLASYGTPSYEGYAFVLFERDGKLFEVNASHCSCYGVEGQWKPEETTVEALLHRVEKGDLGHEPYQENRFDNELRKILADKAANKP